MFGVTVDLASSSSLSLSIFTPNHNLFFFCQCGWLTIDTVCTDRACRLRVDQQG